MASCPGVLAPHILRVASLGHQLLDVVRGLRPRQAAQLFRNLAEGRLHVLGHVLCISAEGEQKHFFQGTSLVIAIFFFLYKEWILFECFMMQD